MKLLKCSSPPVLLGAGLLLLSYCRNARGAQWQGYYPPHVQTMPAPQSHGFIGSEPDLTPPGQQAYTYTGRFLTNNTDWDQTVHLEAGENPDPLGVPMQVKDGEGVKAEALVAGSAQSASVKARGRALLLLNLLLLAAGVVATHFAFSAHYKAQAVREAAEEARVRAAQGQEGLDEAARRHLTEEELFLAAYEKGYHLVPDDQYVKLVERASTAEVSGVSRPPATAPYPMQQEPSIYPSWATEHFLNTPYQPPPYNPGYTEP